MTMIKNTTTTGPPSTSSRRTTFLGCFGYSGEKMQVKDHKANSVSRRRRWISEWSFSCKKSGTKTVHFNTVNRKSKSVNDAPAKSDVWEIQVVEEDTALTKKHVIMVTSEEQKTCRKKWTDVVKRQNGSFRSSRKDTKPAAAATSATGVNVESQGKKRSVTIAQPSVSTPLKPLTHSKSLPANTKRPKPPKARPAGGGVVEGGSCKTTLSGGEFDSIIAMSILLMILVIMLLWGKICAIICTCAWFTVAPRLVAAGEHAPVTTVERRLSESENNMNLESVEYKKKVVLEGLLQRNHRNVVGRL